MWVIETIVCTGYENDPLHLCTKVDRLNFIHMEIKEIKALLSMETVLGYYNLKPDKNDRLLCPFHPDKTPSLQIYPKTGTYCCFSSHCTAGTGDTIQFIQFMDKCSKHEAIVKAAALIERYAHYTGETRLGQAVHRSRRVGKSRPDGQGVQLF